MAVTGSIRFDRRRRAAEGQVEHRPERQDLTIISISDLRGPSDRRGLAVITYRSGDSLIRTAHAERGSENRCGHQNEDDDDNRPPAKAGY